MRRWFIRREHMFDWFTAWFGGSAATAFGLAHPDLGWMWVAAALLTGACGVTAHVMRPPPLTSPGTREV